VRHAAWSPPLSRLLWTAVGGLMAIYLVVFALSTVVRVIQPAEFLYGEAIVLDQARRIALGQPLYPPPFALPLTVTAYTPLYYLLVGWLQRLSGDTGYTLGRLVSVVAALGSAVLLAWSVRSVVGRWSAGWLTAGLFLTQNLIVLLWASTHRVDLLGLCLTLCGLALATAGRTTAAALPLVLAVLTKQTYLAAPVAVCLLLWPRRGATLRFLGLYVGGVLVAVGISVVLGGGSFVWHTITANANPLDFEYFARMLGAFLQFNALPLCLAAGLFAFRERSAERLWRAYFLVTGVLTLATIGKIGASSNYWLELSAAIAVLIGILVGRLAADPVARAPFASTGLPSLVLASLLMAIPAYQATAYQTLQLRLTGATGAIEAQLQTAPLLATESGDVLTDDPGLALLAGKNIQFEFVIFTLLAVHGVWDEGPILSAIHDRRFDLVVLEQSLDDPPRRLVEARWTENVRDGLRAAYQPAGQYAGYWLYRPNTFAGR
jgi:hypothetical protein